jgi:type IV pilus assembly protein PilV
MKNQTSSLPVSSRRSQQGVTLLEVLISIVVLAIGLLGYAGLQTVSLKNNLSAYHRSQATMLAYDVIDRIRANRPNCESYELDFGAVPVFGDLANWKAGVVDALPDADAEIQFDPAECAAGTSTVAKVTLRWDDNRDGDAFEFVTETAL